MPKMATIGANAFEGCTGLTTLTLPSTITSIGLRAFKDCTNMVYIDATAATSFSPENATRNYVFGQDSPFWEMNNDDVVIYLADGVSPANCSPNVVLTSGSNRTCPDFQHDIAGIANLPYGFTATKLTVTGLSIEDGKQGLYLPFSIDAANATALGTLQKVKVTDGAVTQEPATSMEANTPYLLTTTADVTSVNADNTGFFKVASTGVTIGAGKAYLQLPTTLASKIGTGSPAPCINLIFEDDVTGISERVEGVANGQTVYDLQGRRVAQPQKGLYIVNGKKVLIK